MKSENFLKGSVKGAVPGENGPNETCADVAPFLLLLLLDPGSSAAFSSLELQRAKLAQRKQQGLEREQQGGWPGVSGISVHTKHRNVKAQAGCF